MRKPTADSHSLSRFISSLSAPTSCSSLPRRSLEPASASLTCRSMRACPSAIAPSAHRPPGGSRLHPPTCPSGPPPVRQNQSPLLTRQRSLPLPRRQAGPSLARPVLPQRDPPQHRHAGKQGRRGLNTWHVETMASPTKQTAAKSPASSWPGSECRRPAGCTTELGEPSPETTASVNSASPSMKAAAAQTGTGWWPSRAWTRQSSRRRP